jgi:pilus assembly protein CpaC
MNFNFFQTSRNETVGSVLSNLITIPPNGPIQRDPAGNLFFTLTFPHSSFIGVLEALEQENLAKILAHPRLVATSGNLASFLDGGEQAVPVPAGLGQVGVQFEEFGTRLNFLPIVLGNGRIHLEVEPEISTLDPSAGVSIANSANVPGRATQRIHTTVELESGQTFVIGGLIQKITTGAATRIPVLGQLPFVGALFSNKSSVEDEVELVVMVTPHLVDAQSCDQVVKVLPGQESRSPDDFELFLEGILEAPRGPREVFQGKRYVPAFRNGPTANLFPVGPSRGGAGVPGSDHGMTISNHSSGAPAAPGALPPGIGAPAPSPASNGGGTEASPTAGTAAELPPPLGAPAGSAAAPALPPGVVPLSSGAPPVPEVARPPASAAGDKPQDGSGVPGTRP